MNQIHSQEIKTNFTQSTCFFGVVKLTKNVDPDKYKYGDPDILFDARTKVSW